MSFTCFEAMEICSPNNASIGLFFVHLITLDDFPLVGLVLWVCFSWISG